MSDELIRYCDVFDSQRGILDYVDFDFGYTKEELRQICLDEFETLPLIKSIVRRLHSVSSETFAANLIAIDRVILVKRRANWLMLKKSLETDFDITLDSATFEIISTDDKVETDSAGMIVNTPFTLSPIRHETVDSDNTVVTLATNPDKRYLYDFTINKRYTLAPLTGDESVYHDSTSKITAKKDNTVTRKRIGRASAKEILENLERAKNIRDSIYIDIILDDIKRDITLAVY